MDTITANPDAAARWLLGHTDPASKITPGDRADALSKLVALSESRGFAPWNEDRVLSAANGDYSSYSMFPIKDLEAYKMYKQQQSTLWTADEIDFAADAAEYPTLPARYQELYLSFLAFFSPGDGIVTEQAARFLAEAKTYPEIAFLTLQLYNESTHSETYGLAVSSVIPSAETQASVFSAINRLDCVKQKALFIKKYMDAPLPLGTRYFAAALAEGVFFAALFAIVFYLKSKNVMKQFALANSFIARDEAQHRNFNAAMAKRYRSLTSAEAHAITADAVDVEVGHLRHILAEPIESEAADAAGGVTIPAIESYIKTLADQCLVLAGFESLYHQGDAAIELPWMATMSLVRKSNFYETTVVEYGQNSVKAALEKAVSTSSAAASAALAPEDVDF